MNDQDAGQFDPSAAFVPQPCRALPESIIRELLDQIPVGVVLIHHPTRSVYANSRGADLLALIGRASRSSRSRAAMPGLQALIDAVAEPEGTGHITIQCPDEPAPSLCSVARVPLGKLSAPRHDWTAWCIERDCCQGFLDCPTVRCWLPLLLGNTLNSES